jgi:hypothetical protein
MTDILTDIITEVVTEIVTEVAELEAPEAAPEEGAAPAEPDPEADTPGAAHEHAFPTGSAAQLILDCFLDGESDQLSMQAIKAALAHLAGNTIEQAVLRLHKRGRLLRVSPGTYKLGSVAPSTKSVEPVPQPQPESAPTDEEWLAALEAHLVNPASWNADKLGPPPVSPDHRVPADIFMRFADRVRKREARRRDAEAAAARQAEADRQLRDRLIEAAGGNFTPGPSIDDVSPIRAALQLTDIDTVLTAVLALHDRKLSSSARPAVTWRDEALLRKIAELFCRQLVRRLVAEWSKAKAPPSPAERAELSVATEATPGAENAPVPSPQQPDGVPDGDLGELDQAAAIDMRGLLAKSGDESLGVGSDHIIKPESNAEAATADAIQIMDGVARPPAADRADILRAFRRTTAPPQPAPQPDAARQERPWFANQQAPQPAGGMSDDGWRFLLEGFRAGNVAWPRKHGPPPGTPGCRIPSRILREFGLEPATP